MELELILQEVGTLHLEKRLAQRENAALKGQLLAASQRITELEAQKAACGPGDQTCQTIQDPAL